MKGIKLIAFYMSLLLLVAGCGSSQKEYVFTNGGGTPPPTPTTTLTVTPDSRGIIDGQTLQYVATANYPDGTTADVTGDVVWSSANPSVASISATGLATGETRGQTNITATLAGVSDSAVLSVNSLTIAYSLDSSGTSLVSFETSAPTDVTARTLDGLTPGDTLVGIDFRPQNGLLYGLGFNSGTGDLQLYCVSVRSNTPTSVKVTPVGSPIAEDFAPETTFGFDFNPAVDRIRVVASNGENFRLNPNTGTLAGADTVLSGPSTSADGAAYTNNAANAVATTLYTLDATTSSLYIQNPPNDGTLTNRLNIRENGAAVPFTNVGGFDIPPGVDVAASNDVANGQGFAVFNIGGNSFLHAINLADGNTFNLGQIGSSGGLRGLSVLPGGPAAVALSAGGSSLVRFNINTPETLTTTPVTGVTAGETVIGIDFRPTTGQLYGLGVNHTADTGTVYILDPQNGSATAVGAPSSVSFVNILNLPIDLPDPATAGYGFDFNPVVDRIRITASNGLNARLNPITGVGVDGDTDNAGTQPDGNVNGAATGVSGAGYINSRAGATTTDLYTIDGASNSLFIQNPPNAGTQTLVGAITLGGSPLDFSEVNGFDIGAEANPSTSGVAVAVLTVGGAQGLYYIRLSDGQATLISPVTGVWSGLALGERYSF